MAWSGLEGGNWTSARPPKVVVTLTIKKRVDEEPFAKRKHIQ